MRKTTTLLAACLALTLAACGGDDDEQSAGTTPATTAAAEKPKDDVVTVDMRQIEYVPRNVTAKVGQTVRWTNSDPVAHTVTATRGAKVDSGTIDANGTFATRFQKPGRVDYVCTIHPKQTGTVTVVR